MKLWAMVSFILVGLLFISLSIPMVLRQVPPNGIYGFRVHRTLEDPVVWYEANAYSGRTMIWAGVATIITAIILALIPGIRDISYVALVVGVMLVSVTVSLVLSWRHLSSL